MLYSPLIICDLLVIPPSLFFEFRSQSTLDQHNDEIGSRRISSQIYPPGPRNVLWYYCLHRYRVQYADIPHLV